ncbi:MAG: phosphatidate cytidylyltransferase [Microbacteriaceae bacterium]|jgi:phosphatidate cytidylyltransferase
MSGDHDKHPAFDNALSHIEEANERVNKRAGRDLEAAIAAGLGLGAGVIVTLCVVDKAWFMVFGGLFLLGTSSIELALAFRNRNLRVPLVPVALTVVATVPVAFYFGPLWAWATIVVGFALTALVQLILSTRPSWQATSLRSSVAAAAFSLAYVLGLGSFSIALVALPGGQWWALSMLILTTSADIGAFASGVLFGKHPMAPRISPKKTWEGFAGAVIAVTIAGTLIATFSIHESIWVGLLLGVLVLMTATAGDLFESQLKRWIGIKDMSRWLAGHGGFLDRIDSVLPSGVIVYVVYVVLASLNV